jgi:hypothetical protein
MELPRYRGKKKQVKEFNMEENKVMSHSFDHGGKTYVIKIFQVGLKYVAKPFCNNKAASCYSYSVEVENMDDWQNLYGDKPSYLRLMEIVELDIKAGFGVSKI